MHERILIVEDEETLRRNLTRFLARQEHEVDAFATAEDALDAAGEKEYTVALIDVRLPGKDGITMASELLDRWPDMAIVLMTAYASVESVIDAMRAGVHDYLLKPVLLREVAQKVGRAAEMRRLTCDNASLRARLVSAERREVVAKSERMRQVVDEVRRAAASSRPVLLQGESGSGKEVLARLLHDTSPRAGGPFVTVSVPAIAESMIETCLFGHERGVVGPDARREGVIRAASGGTLLLDDVGDMPLAHQAKLLRALEAGEVLPVGADRPVPVDTRVVAVTSLDLAELVRERRFREDLYFRLSALTVQVPPLRAHPEDIPALAGLFLERYARERGGFAPDLDAAAERRLMAYAWPGNVRELANVMERAALACEGHTITPVDLPPVISGSDAQGHEGDYARSMESFERALIRSALERADGDRREAARALGLPLATLYRRIEKLGLKESPRAEPGRTGARRT
ncbi:MAG: sigma-54 dependent transcriptional regulator [Polyangiaceae bacterium]